MIAFPHMVLAGSPHDQTSLRSVLFANGVQRCLSHMGKKKSAVSQSFVQNSKITECVKSLLVWVTAA